MSFISVNSNNIYPEEISNYDEVRDFLPIKKNEWLSTIYYYNMVNMQEFLKILKYKNLINNKISAEKLPYSEVKKSGLDDPHGNSYLRYDHIFSLGEYLHDIDKFDLEDVKNGKAVLRVNKNAIYTVRKTQGRLGPEYVFRTYFATIFNNSLQSSYLDLRSQCCIESIPDITFFKDKVKEGTTLDEIKENVRDVKFIQISANNGCTSFAFADKYGSVLNVYYSKDVDGKFKVTKMNWVCEGANVLPYLLPIDMQLIDPSYVPPADEKPGCSIM